MTEVNKAQIGFMRKALELINEGNFKELQEAISSTLDRLETEILRNEAEKLEDKNNFAVSFGIYIQDSLNGEDWYLLNKTVEELFDLYKNQ